MLWLLCVISKREKEERGISFPAVFQFHCLYHLLHTTHTRRYLRDLKRIEAENDPNDHLNIASNDAEAQKIF